MYLTGKLGHADTDLVSWWGSTIKSPCVRCHNLVLGGRTPNKQLRRTNTHTPQTHTPQTHTHTVTPSLCVLLLKGDERFSRLRCGVLASVSHTLGILPHHQPGPVGVPPAAGKRHGFESCLRNFRKRNFRFRPVYVFKTCMCV